MAKEKSFDEKLLDTLKAVWAKHHTDTDAMLEETGRIGRARDMAERRRTGMANPALSPKRPLTAKEKRELGPHDPNPTGEPYPEKDFDREVRTVDGISKSIFTRKKGR